MPIICAVAPSEKTHIVWPLSESADTSPTLCASSITTWSPASEPTHMTTRSAVASSRRTWLRIVAWSSASYGNTSTEMPVARQCATMLSLYASPYASLEWIMATCVYPMSAFQNSQTVNATASSLAIVRMKRG